MNIKKWSDLKKFVNNLTEAQLKQKVVIEVVENGVYKNVFCGVTKEDVYMYDNDSEDIGSLDLLKETHDSFDKKECQILTKKGSVYIGADN